MTSSIEALVFFLIVIGAAFIMPELAKKIKIPYVTSIVIAGILVGPFGFKVLRLSETAEFLAIIGAIFLMFIAGLDVKLSSLKKLGHKVVIIAVINAVIPSVSAYFLAIYFGYSHLASLILAIIFISSSVGIIIPSLTEAKLIKTPLAKSIVGATVLEDMVSLLIFAIVLQSASPTSFVPLPIYLFIIAIFLVVVYKILPKFEKDYIKDEKQKKETQKQDIFEGEFKYIFIILIAMAIFFEALGMHAIIAGFIVGLLLSDGIKRRLVYDKIHTIAYAFFIPIFFLIVGMRTDLGLIITAKENIIITAAIIGTLLITKFVSGWVAGKLTGFSNLESAAIGASTTPQMSTSLVVALVALEYGLFDNIMINAIVIMSITTTLFAPSLMSFFYKKIAEKS